MNIVRFVKSLLNNGVLPGFYNEKDPRTFAARVVAGDITKEDLTEAEFCNAQHLDLIDQKGTDFCVGAGKAYHKQNTEGKKMSWSGAYALGCKAIGYVPEWGISILAVMKGAAKYGCPEEAYWPFNGDRDASADYTKMSATVLKNAETHRDGSFFVIDSYPSGFDQFDAFRAYLNKFRSEKVIIQTGVDNHNVTLIGQKRVDGVLCLYGPDSYAERENKYRLGKTVKGYRYFTRSEVNQMFEGYMAFDMPRPVAELLNAYNLKAVKFVDSPDCWLVKDGKRHLLKNEAIAWAHNTLLYDDSNVFIISQGELELIPIGEHATFDSGSNRAIIRRILEKTGNTALINAE